MSGSTPTCVTCQYALAYPPIPTKLWCRRYPPVVAASNPGQAIYPVVGLPDWCGEYAAASPPTSPPGNLTAPVVTQTGTGVGATLSCTTGTWNNQPTTYAYQWFRGGTVAVGTNAPTYTVTSNDVGRTLSCTVTATNAVGPTAAPSNGVTVA